MTNKTTIVLNKKDWDHLNEKIDRLVNAAQKSDERARHYEKTLLRIGRTSTDPSLLITISDALERTRSSVDIAIVHIRLLQLRIAARLWRPKNADGKIQRPN